MSRIAYVNGAYVPHDMAFVHIDDRGYQFADGVYEVVSVIDGKMIDEEPHLDRLWRSMDELQMTEPVTRAALKLISKQLVKKNHLKNALLYIQVTRGVAKRDHAFPQGDLRSSLVMTCRRFDFGAVRERAKTGIKVSSQPDIRWGRCDIKATALLPNVLAKQAAKEVGAFEAVLFDADNNITEGSSTSVWMVDDNGTLVTRPLNDNILPGITRATLIELAEKHQIKIEERAFSLEEAKAAKEMFLTSATSCAMPIVELDGCKIADGKPGSVATKLVELYWDFAGQ